MLTSEEHRRKFEIKNDIFKVERNPTDDGKLVLTINMRPIGEWFKDQFNKLQYSLHKPTGDPKKGKGIKLYTNKLPLELNGGIHSPSFLHH